MTEPINIGELDKIMQELQQLNEDLNRCHDVLNKNIKQEWSGDEAVITFLNSNEDNRLISKNWGTLSKKYTNAGFLVSCTAERSPNGNTTYVFNRRKV